MVSRKISMTFNAKAIHVLNAFDVLCKEQNASRRDTLVDLMARYNLEHDPDGLVRCACGDPKFNEPEIPEFLR